MTGDLTTRTMSVSTEKKWEDNKSQRSSIDVFTSPHNTQKKCPRRARRNNKRRKVAKIFYYMLQCVSKIDTIVIKKYYFSCNFIIQFYIYYIRISK